MAPPGISHPGSSYLRLVEYQKNIKLESYHPDLPLVLFITFSRMASGLSIVSVFFPPSIFRTGVALALMGLATLASIAHLSVPLRFLTMVRNNRSFLVWEIRLAGALTALLALHFLTFLGYFERFHTMLPWVNFVISILFLASTAWAYRFASHPAWNTSILAFYYLASACMMGLVLRAMYYPLPALPLLYTVLLVAEAFLLFLYRNHLRQTSPTALQDLTTGREKWIFLAFLWTSLLLPATLTSLIFFEGYHRGPANILMAMSCFTGILLERVLFFTVERPVFFFSFVWDPNGEGQHWIRG